jgi:predicted transglutaminase-like cysteine proteinase
MTQRRQSTKPGSSAFMATMVFAVGLHAAAPSAYAEETAATEAKGDFIPGADGTTNRPPATFFTINQVLAKLDRERGKGPGATRLAALAPSNVATDAQPMGDPPPAGKALFGLFAFRAPEGMLWRKWRGIEADIAKDNVVLEQCRTNPEGCPSYAAQFLRLISAVKARSGRGQLDEANRAVNMPIRYASDFAQHGEADRWSAPLATFATGKGDCEDYAIAKYVALIEAGFPRDDLQMVLMRDRAVRQDHAVLAARLDGHWLILDNRRSELIAESDATSFTPLFAINHRGVQLFAAPFAKRPILGSEVEPAPAAANDGDVGEWSGRDLSSDGGTQSMLPLLM